MAVIARQFEPRLTRQSAASLDALASKVDENLLMLKRSLGDVTENVTRIMETFNITGGGTGAGGIAFGGGDDIYGDQTGAEVWVAERMFDFATAGSPCSIVALGQALVASGVGTFRLRAGGTSGAADGALLSSLISASPSFALVSTPTGATAPNPGGRLPLKLTVQSPPGVLAQIKSVTVWIR